jgi:hypothetical protein
MDEVSDSGHEQKSFLRGMLVVIGIITVILLFQHYVSRKTSFHDVLVKTADELNKNCPMMTDDDTRLDSAVALPGNILQYNYTFINLLKDSLDPELLGYSLKPAMISNARKNPDLELFRKNNVTFLYNFKDKEGNHIMKVRVSPEDYLNPNERNNP